jgi:hypothetical protein
LALNTDLAAARISSYSELTDIFTVVVEQAGFGNDQFTCNYDEAIALL